jgi:hypothetical protein
MFYWAADPGEKLDAQQYDWGSSFHTHITL